MTTRIPVELPDRAYDVVVGRDLLSAITEHVPPPEHATRAVVVTQAPVAEHHLPPVEAALREAGLEPWICEVVDGEVAKDLATLSGLYGRLADLPLGRDDLVVALGGGVVGDLAGFLAATWNRGVAVLQVPTTLLAQVDAAVGGKTGVNLPQGKNLVGAFHQPLGVVADVDTLATLPERIRIEGLGEVVKYGLIRDPVILDLLERRTGDARAGTPDLLEELVQRSVAVKAAVVAADERESGERAHLNLGHTYGHAVEALTGYEEVLHGEAVAIGTCVALHLGRRMGLTPPDLVERGIALLDALGLPTRGPALARGQVGEVMARDKKARGGVRFVVVDGAGSARVVRPDPADVDAAIAEATEG